MDIGGGLKWADNNNNNNNNFIWVLNFPVSSMDFTNKLIYIYDRQKWNMTILTIRIEKEEKKKKIIQVSQILYSVTETVLMWNNLQIN